MERPKQYRMKKKLVMRDSTSSYASRKRQLRRLWISRIEAVAKANNLSYGEFMHGLKEAGININIKILAEMAVNNYKDFAKLLEIVKKVIVEFPEWEGLIDDKN